MMRGVDDNWLPDPGWSAKQLRDFQNRNSIRGYGLVTSMIGGRALGKGLNVGSKLKTVGALLGLAGLGAAGVGVHGKLTTAEPPAIPGVGVS
jgi:hypothetical protein